LSKWFQTRRFLWEFPTSNQDGRQAKNMKKGGRIKNKSSPLKLLSQFHPNFAEVILGWTLQQSLEGPMLS
jgi:hypothetical protein